MFRGELSIFPGYFFEMFIGVLLRPIGFALHSGSLFLLPRCIKASAQSSLLLRSQCCYGTRSVVLFQLAGDWIRPVTPKYAVVCFAFT